MKGKLAKKRFLSMQPDFGYLNAGASRRRTGNLRTRLGAAILLLILLAIFLVPAFVPYGYAQIITVDGQRDRGAKNLAPFAVFRRWNRKPSRAGKPSFPTSLARMNCAATTSCG